MVDTNTLSESEEMYLVTIRKICESCTDTPIPIPDLAVALDVLPVSVNQMVKKLADSGLVMYTPYKGVELTDEGRSISAKILRHRRLWEVFLVRDLSMELNEADALACRLEHITNEDVAQRLSSFLGDPLVCFHGSPIYPGNGVTVQLGIPLDQVNAGEKFLIQHIDLDDSTAAFLREEGIHPGVEATLNVVSSSGALLMESSHGQQVSITKNIAEKIIVEVKHD